MATREIKTTISLDGEQSFKKALASATGEMRVLESELKAVSAAYDVNGNSAQFFAAKQQNLRNQISQQREIVQSLERAVEDAAQAYGESSSQVDGYAIRLNNARARMSRLEKELEATDREVEELGRDAVRAGRQLEDGIGEGAEQAENSLKSLISTMQQDISSIRTSSAVSAVTGLWDLATGAYNAVTGFVESGVEYSRQLSFLEQNAKSNGYDFSVLVEQLDSVEAVTGDASSAMEGLSELLAAGVDSTKMDKALENLLGVSIKFQDTMNFEGIADGLQETLATGSATGAFAEALERLGVDVEEFNKALAESPTAAGDLDIALSYLAANGMAEVYKQWLEDNEQINNYSESVSELKRELSTAGTDIGGTFLAPVNEALAELVHYFNELNKYGRENGKEAAEQKLRADLAAPVISDMERQGRSQAEIDAAKKLLAGEAGNAETALLLKQRSDELGLWITESLKGFLKNWQDEEQAKKNASPEAVANLDAEAQAFEQAVKNWGDFNEGVETSAQIIQRVTAALERDYQRQPGGQIPEGVADITGPSGETIPPIGVREDWQEILKGIEADTKEGAAALQQAGADAGTALSTGFDQAAPTENLFPTTVIVETENARPAMTTAGQDAGQALAEGFEDSVREVEQTGGEAGEGAGQAFVEGANGYESQAYRMGAALGSLYADGISSQYGRIVGAASKASAGALGALSVAPGGSYGPPAPSGNVTAVLNLDGRTFARITAPYMAAALVKQ